MININGEPNMNKEAIEQIIRGMTYMVNDTINNNMTKVYDGIVISNNNDGRWNVKYNGETHPVKPYGPIIPNVNAIVKVIVPQGNQALSWFFISGSDTGGGGNNGVTFIPSVSEDGIISWTNNGGLPNPTPVDIMGPQGNPGQNGTNGTDGENGATFTPSVNSNGDLSWTNDKGLSNPVTVNIRGPQGVQGNPGSAGQDGADATVNGVNTLTIEATGGLTGTQSGNTYSISGENLPYLKTTGGTLTGNLTGKYLTGTWLQSTAVYELNSSNFKGVCVFDGSGLVYYRTKEHFLADIGAVTQDYVDSAVANAGGVKKFNGTLGPNSWTTSSGDYQYQAQINISDMTAESVPNVYPQWTNQSVESIEWNKLSAIESFNGYVQFYATSPFSVSIDYVIEY